MTAAKRKFMRARNRDGVTHEEDAAMKPMKGAATHLSRDCRGTDAQDVKLPAGDQAQLAPRDPGDRMIAKALRAAAGAQKVTELRRRHELGDIRTLRDSFWPTSSGGVDIG